MPVHKQRLQQGLLLPALAFSPALPLAFRARTCWPGALLPCESMQVGLPLCCHCFSELHISSVGLVHAEDDAVASLRLRLITLPHNLGAQELAKWV